MKIQTPFHLKQKIITYYSVTDFMSIVGSVVIGIPYLLCLVYNRVAKYWSFQKFLKVEKSKKSHNNQKLICEAYIKKLPLIKSNIREKLNKGEVSDRNYDTARRFR